MKQYKKGRPNPIQLYYCNGKRCGSECPGSEYCHLASAKRFARKDQFGKPIKWGRLMRDGKGGK